MDIAAKSLEHDIQFTNVDDNLTSREALKSLENTIRVNKDNYLSKSDSIPENHLRKTWIRKLIKIADYQYGLGSGNKLFVEGIKTKRNQTGTKIKIFNKKNNESIGRFDFRTGQIKLSINGVKKLLPFEENINYLIFDGEKIKGSNLFRPGVIDFSPNIMPESNVFVLNKTKQKIIAVGNAIIGSNNIKNTKKGIVAEIYEKI
jgi:predicted RNA-binding protein (TIGR00451 family)